MRAVKHANGSWEFLDLSIAEARALAGAAEQAPALDADALIRTITRAFDKGQTFTSLTLSEEMGLTGELTKSVGQFLRNPVIREYAEVIGQNKRGHNVYRRTQKRLVG